MAERRTKNKPRRSRIDLSDVSPSVDQELKVSRGIGRPITGNAKQLIAIRIDPKLLVTLRKMASKKKKPYQTLIHELLEQATRRWTAPLTSDEIAAR